MTEAEQYKTKSVLSEDELNRYSTAKQQSFHTTIVGTTFRNSEHIDLINDGDFAFLTAELDNKADPNAVVVVHNETGNHIGYIKRELNKDIWNNIVNNGDLYVCRITKTGDTPDKPTKGFNIKVIRMYFDKAKELESFEEVKVDV